MRDPWDWPNFNADRCTLALSGRSVRPAVRKGRADGGVGLSSDLGSHRDAIVGLREVVLSNSDAGIQDVVFTVEVAG